MLVSQANGNLTLSLGKNYASLLCSARESRRQIVVDRDSPDDSRAEVNICAFATFPQHRRFGLEHSEVHRTPVCPGAKSFGAISINPSTRCGLWLLERSISSSSTVENVESHQDMLTSRAHCNKHRCAIRTRDPFAIVIFCTSDPQVVDARTRSKWSRALRFAARCKPHAQELAAFIKSRGGINECAARSESQIANRKAPFPSDLIVRQTLIAARA
jgi:hypothetical protein